MGMLFLFLSNILAQQANTGNDDLQREIFTNDKYRFKVKLNEDEVKYASTKPQNTNIYNLAKSEGLVPSYVMTIFINPKAIAKYGKLPFPVTQAFDTLMKGGLQFDKDKGTFVFNKGPLVKLWSEDPDQCIRNCIKKKREEEAKKRKENEKNMRKAEQEAQKKKEEERKKEEEQRKKEQKAREEAEKSSSSDSSDSEKENKDKEKDKDKDKDKSKDKDKENKGTKRKAESSDSSSDKNKKKKTSLIESKNNNLNASEAAPSFFSINP